ncbi:MAG: peroxiredoxin [Mariprofundales bacterium]|nr:peroxiredoxin [Mariprofundales bacterium]
MADYKLNIGDTAPTTIACATYPDSSETTLTDYAGKWVVIYFYPKDSTPGCTTEACEFRDRQANGGMDNGTVVLGVSRDTIASHQRFATKQELNFPLLSDPDEALCRAFDVMQEKNMYGRTTIGVERSTFIIDPAGVVRAVWRKVRVKGHVDLVLDKLTELKTVI